MRRRKNSEIDNHKVFEFGTKVTVSVSSQGGCWNSASTIRFSFSGAQLYFSDDTPVNSGQSYSFASLPPLYLIAAGPSCTWDKVMISATAYPNHNLDSGSNSGSGYSDSGYWSSSSGSAHPGHSNAACYANDSGTAYRINVTVNEKPWGGTWGGVEDAGSYQSPVRSWYHLWKINENAIRANVTPSEINDLVTDTSFDGLSVSDFSSVTDAPAVTTPQWKKITADAGNYSPTKATVIADGISLEGSKTPVDIAVNDIESVQWEGSVTSQTIQNDDQNPSTKITMHLAELFYPGSNVDKGAGYYFDEYAQYTVFPTFSPRTSPQAPESERYPYNQARVIVKLKQNVLSGMTATVHLAWFDPKNYVGYDYHITNASPSNTWTPDSEGDANICKDNGHGGNFNPLTFLYGTNTLVFRDPNYRPNGNSDPIYSTSTTRKAIVEFTGECFGDNYIIAAHPNSGVVEKYHFQNDATGETLLRPGSTESIFDELRTAVLHVGSWKGFKVPCHWIYDVAAYSIETSEKDGESYAKSVLKINYGFDLTLNYRFDHVRGAGGYVLKTSQQEKPKLSFVPNSGVKLGSTAGTSAGAYEIAILDVGLMVSMVGGMSAFQNQNTNTTIKGIQDNSDVANIPVPNSATNKKYEKEPLSKLMNGVGYGKDYSLMLPYNTASDDADGNPNNNQPWEKYWNTLSNNVANTNSASTNTMIISWRREGNRPLKVHLNAIANYFVDNVSSMSDEHLYIQSHWGSGVIYDNVNIVRQ